VLSWLCLGLVPDEVYRQFCRKRDRVEKLLVRLKEFKLRPEPWVADRLKELGSAPIKNITSLGQLLKRNGVFFEHLHLFDPELSEVEELVAAEVETRIKYEGYIDRQERQVEKLKRMEDVRLPDDIDYQAVHGLSTEVREKLNRVRPVSLGQASRISGVTPAAIMALQVHLKRIGRMQPGVIGSRFKS
jgi:tRNA uridine 5-carboxymethylaminomethyl modification enzyme